MLVHMFRIKNVKINIQKCSIDLFISFPNITIILHRYILITLIILSTGTDRFEQTVKTQIRLLLKAESTLLAIPSASFERITTL